MNISICNISKNNEIHYIKINSEELMLNIVDIIELKGEQFGETINILDTNKFTYNLIYNSNYDTNENNINKLGCEFGKDDVYGNCVLIKLLIETKTLIDFTEDDLLYLQDYVKNNKYVNIDEELNETELIMENIMEIETLKDIVCQNFSIHNIDLFIISDKYDTGKKYNKKLYYLTDKKYYGNIKVLRLKNNILTSLSIETFNLLVKLKECKHDNPDDEFLVTYPIYGLYLLEKNNIFKCNSCNKTLSNVYYTCKKCYSVHYDSIQCQQDDWEFHKRNCN